MLRVLRDAIVPQSKVLGVGVGLPGIIDTDRGICNFSHLLWWRDVDLAGPLRKRLGLPVWVDNDVNTLAVAEKWAGDAPDARDFVTLSVGRGVGLGIVIDRSIYQGPMGPPASSVTSSSNPVAPSVSADVSAASRRSSARAPCEGAWANVSDTTSRGPNSSR